MEHIDDVQNIFPIKSVTSKTLVVAVHIAYFSFSPKLPTLEQHITFNFDWQTMCAFGIGHSKNMKYWTLT